MGFSSSLDDKHSDHPEHDLRRHSGLHAKTQHAVDDRRRQVCRDRAHRAQLDVRTRRRRGPLRPGEPTCSGIRARARLHLRIQQHRSRPYECLRCYYIGWSDPDCDVRGRSRRHISRRSAHLRRLRHYTDDGHAYARQRGRVELVHRDALDLCHWRTCQAYRDYREQSRSREWQALASTAMNRCEFLLPVAGAMFHG
jgi:hypothetical protein